MTDTASVDRRTVLRTVAAAAATSLGVSTAGAATADTPDPTAESAESMASPAQHADSVGSGRTGLYSGTVDRIVDGSHVVVLLEADGRVRDQYVVSRDQYPGLNPRDSVTLFVFRGRLLAIW